ncbi:MAG: HAMP domain-containing protein [Ignavibacteria bacterium]|jgi:methyl-accepting chemotaxis protein|nr:HAMP domain-containing protein [Ignavibacteria bacterium]
MKLELNTIKSKMLLYILGGVFALFLVLSLIILSIVYNKQKTVACQSTQEMTEKIAMDITSDILSADNGLKAFNKVVETYSSKNRHELSQMTKEFFLDNEQFAGVFTVFEPNAFDGNDAKYINNADMPGNESGRFTAYWNKNGGAVVLKRSSDQSFASGDYYQLPKSTGRELIMEPYLYDGVLMTSIVYPIMKDGQFNGVTGADISIDYLDKKISKQKVLETGRVEVVSANGTYLASRNKEYLGKKKISDLVQEAGYDGLKEVGDNLRNNNHGYIETYDPVNKCDVAIFYAPVNKAGWGVIVTVPISEVLAGAGSVRNTLIVIEILFLLVIALIVYYISVKITDPIKKLTVLTSELSKGHVKYRAEIVSNDEIGTMGKQLNSFANQLEDVSDKMYKISQGEVDVTIQVQDEKDEFSPAINAIPVTLKKLLSETDKITSAAAEGILSVRGNEELFSGGYKSIVQGINLTLEEIVKPIQESSHILEKIASGDLTARMNGEYKGDYQIIKHSVNQLADSINTALSEVSEAVHATASAANEISSSSEQMAAGAQEQSQQATEVAGAIEEMTKTVYETARNANEASSVSMGGSQAAERGAKKIEETKKGISKIVSSSDETARIVASLSKRTEQIGEITQVIDDIADQTNLLALNAAIEAARAGEQGRGFAVVADEVRKLAERTTKATKEIADTIMSIQLEAREADSSMNDAKQAVEEGMKLTEEVSEVLGEILGGARKTTDVVLQVAAASEEQSSAAEQISKNIEGISSVTQQSAAGTEQIARAAEDLNRLTVNLQGLVSRFKLEEIRLEKNGAAFNGRHAKALLYNN